MFKNNFLEKVDPGPCQDGGFSAELLSQNDIPHFLTLQQQVRNALPLRKKDHLKAFSVQDLLTHMGAGMPVLGIKNDNGEMLAQAVLSLPFDRHGKDYLKNHPMLNGYDDGISVLESLCVRSVAPGQYFADMLLGYAQTLATQHGSQSILAKVSDESLLGAGAFERTGFVQTLCEPATDIDAPVCFYQWLKFREGEVKLMDPNSYPAYLYDLH